MGIGFGGFNPLNPVNALTLATTGPAGPALMATRQLTASFGNQLIQTIGKNLNLPQSTIDLAQASFAGQMGFPGRAIHNLRQAVDSFGREFGGSVTQQADFERDMNNIMSDIARKAVSKSDGKGGEGGKSWLMAIAQMLGDKLNSMAHEMTGLAQEAADDPSKGTMFTAKAQEFGILSNAASTGIKSIGDALSNMARKSA